MNRAPNFDRLARVYRWMEWASFGPMLWRCRSHFLGELGDCRSALVLGDGDGRFTARLLRINPEIKIDAVDASPAMLRSLVDRAGAHRERLQTYCADARAWEPPGRTYDLVVSHFFLDCLTTDEVATLAGRLRSHLAPGARWLISEFAVPESGFGRVVASPLVSGLYLAFGALTGLPIRHLPEHRKVLPEQSFELELRKAFLKGLLVTQLWRAGLNELLHSC